MSRDIENPSLPGRQRVMLTVAEVCNRLDLSVSTIQRAIKRKELKSYKFGRALRVSEEDLAAYIATCRGDEM